MCVYVGQFIGTGSYTSMDELPEDTCQVVTCSRDQEEVSQRRYR
jgi:hypothetical protein